MAVYAHNTIVKQALHTIQITHTRHKWLDVVKWMKHQSRRLL